MDGLWRLDAARLTQGYRAGEFTPVQVLEACLSRINTWQPLARPMVMVDEAGARAAAEASAARWARGQPIGPLDGVPVTLKDNLHAAGLPTTWGSRLLRGHVAAHDEVPVARLRAAGAVFPGKTNLPEFAMQGYTSNRVTGITRNPWDLSRSPGGSSGGAACAVAAGIGPLALVTDGGGSTRRPAAHCGLVGFKPSAGRAARAFGLPELFLDHEVPGLITRTVHDAWLGISTIGSVPVPSEDIGSPGGRVLLVERFGSSPVDPRIVERTREAGRQLGDLGLQVSAAGEFDLAADINARWSTLSASGLAWLMDHAASAPEFGLATGEEPDLDQCTEDSLSALIAGRTARASALFDLLHAIQTLNQRLSALFARHDFILTPTTAALPWPAAERFPPVIDGQDAGPRGHAVFTALANAAGLPAISLPTAPIDGLPNGIQIIGRPGADLAVLMLARHYERAHDWHGAWPAEPDAGAQ